MTQSVVPRLEEIDRLIRATGRQRLFVVADSQAFEFSGAQERLKPILAQYPVRYFTNFRPNPRSEDVSAGANELGDDSDQVVIAIGGGTAIDVAKLICLYAAQDSSPDDVRWRQLIAGDLPAIGCRHPLIAVPTTAGTGSEATHFAVVYVDSTKHSVAHPTLLAPAVVLDPTLTHALPASITAATGLDAVSQAVESMWSVRSTEESIDLGEQALRLGLAHLEQAVRSPKPANREAMMQAAHLAGRAINISRTTAPHALSYYLTIHHQVPHGVAVALSMAAIIRFTGKLCDDTVVDSRGAVHVRAVLDRIAAAFGIVGNPNDAIELAASRWEQMLQRLDCGHRLSDWGVNSADELQQMARAVNPDRLANHPRRISERELHEIVEQIA